MKLTKSRLQQIIKEELEKLSMEEGAMGSGLGTFGEKNKEMQRCKQLEDQFWEYEADARHDQTASYYMYMARKGMMEEGCGDPFETKKELQENKKKKNPHGPD